MDASELRIRFRQIPREIRDGNQSFSIRVWRALSWLERMESLSTDDLEGRFIYGWIGLNAMYGRRGSDSKPWGDRESLGTFLAQVWRIDSHGYLSKLLGKRQSTVLNVIENKFLCIRFWDGQSARAAREVKAETKAAILGYQKSYRLPILRMVFERMYVMRNQVFHGASTKGGKLNRRTLQLSATIMTEALPAFLKIMIEAGSAEDWGDVNFPPHEDGKPNA